MVSIGKDVSVSEKHFFSAFYFLLGTILKIKYLFHQFNPAGGRLHRFSARQHEKRFPSPSAQPKQLDLPLPLTPNLSIVPKSLVGLFY